MQLAFSLLLPALLLLHSNGCHGAAINWDYEANGPAAWSRLSPRDCAFRAQSPVMLAFGDSTYDKDLPPYELTEQDLSGLQYQVSNDGHKVAIAFNSATPNVSVPGHEGSCFRPQSVHWHWGADDKRGSEHWIDGRQYPMEGHIVMWNCQFYSSFAEAAKGFGGLAVLGAMYEADPTVRAVSPGLSSLLALMSTSPQVQRCAECGEGGSGPAPVDLAAFSLADLLPSDRSQYFLYSGSLTTPDCSENVMWTVYRQPIRVPPSLLAAFRSLKFPDGGAMVDNFRPAVPLNPFNPFGARRIVVRSFKDNSGSATVSAATSDSG